MSRHKNLSHRQRIALRKELWKIHQRNKVQGPTRIIFEPAINIENYGVVHLTHHEMADVLMVAQGQSPRTLIGQLYIKQMQKVSEAYFAERALSLKIQV